MLIGDILLLSKSSGYGLIIVIEQFSSAVESNYAIAIASLGYFLKISREFFNHTMRSKANQSYLVGEIFPALLGTLQVYVVATSPDWFITLFSPVVIVGSD